MRPVFTTSTGAQGAEFMAAIRSYTPPMQNMVYADVYGNIGYYAAGMVPIRIG